MSKFVSSEAMPKNTTCDPTIAVSPAEAARRMGIGRTILYELISAGSLKSIKIGSRRLIAVKAIEDCLAAHEVKP